MKLEIKLFDDKQNALGGARLTLFLHPKRGRERTLGPADANVRGEVRFEDVDPAYFKQVDYSKSSYVISYRGMKTARLPLDKPKRVTDKHYRFVLVADKFSPVGDNPVIGTDPQNDNLKRIKNPSFLLKSSLFTGTGLEPGNLTGEEAKIVEGRFNEVLKTRINSIRDSIAGKLPEKKQEVNKIFARLQKLKVEEVAGMELAEVILSEFTDEERRLLKKDEIKVIEEITGSMAGMSVENLLNLDRPLRDNPLFSKDIERAKTLEYAKIIGLKGDKPQKLADREIDIINVDEVKLDGLVKDNILTKKQKDDLLVTTKLSRLTGENFELVAHITKDKMPAHTDLIAMDEADWLKIIKDKKITLPDGEDSPESYARNLNETIEASFPTEYFLGRTIKRETAGAMGPLSSTIEPLLKNKVNPFSREISSLDELGDDAWKNISAAKQKEIKKNFEELRPMVNTYRHLGVGDVIASDTTPQQKQKEISRRVDTLDKFWKNNPELDITRSGLAASPGSEKDDGYNWQGINQTDRPMVKRQMAAYQRTYILGTSQEVAGSLLKGGFDSAYSIISMPEETFIRKSGLGVEKGRGAYNKAIDLALGASHYFEAIRDGIKGNFKDIKVSNQHPLVNDLKELDGFDKLFGSQDFCDCEHCRSIFSPAAYFADLMFFIQENITKNVFTGSRASHPLNLKRRRPDLWKLPMSCQNTTTEIPYLDVVNEVLEDFLKTVLAVGDPYKFLKSADRSVSQPFNLQLEEVRTYLGHFDTDLHGLYRTLGLDIARQYSEKLRLSEDELKIITQADTAGVKKRFGNRSLNKFDVIDFVGYAGITRANLDDLLKTKFLPEIGKVKVVREPGTDVQQFTEVLSSLTEARLDLIHRYLRLWKKTPWSLREFDMLLVSFKSAGMIANLGASSGGFRDILHLGRAVELWENLKLSVEELATIIYRLPQVSLSDNQDPFPERIFDLEKINDNTVADKTPHLLAGLAITESELLILGGLLSADLTQPIGNKLLSDLYRHARIAKSLKMTIDDLKNALLLVNNGNQLNSLDDIEKLADFSVWLKKSPLKVGEMVFILTGDETTGTRYNTTSETLSAKILEIQNHETVTDKSDPSEKLISGRILLESYLRETFNLTEFQLTEEYLKEFTTADYAASSEKALGTTFTSEVPDTPADLDDLLALIHDLERYHLLLAGHQLGPANITWLIANRSLFGIADMKVLTLENIRNISHYRELRNKKEDFDEKLHTALATFQPATGFSGAEDVLGELWEQPLSLIGSLTGNLTLTVPAMKAIRHFGEITEICVRLGIQGDSLQKLVSGDYEVATGIVAGALKSRYADEEERKLKLEPYTDSLNTLKRDALCDYIISREDKFKFRDRGDLYAFFLLSVEMSGCARTSKLVAAISSLQLYIHRCLINLEQSDPFMNPGIENIKVPPTLIPADEWEWRKNYRVWEANRKVFLYPENYIDPTLRDTKSHLFKELEDELLQQKITIQSAEDAYKKYMAGFSELTRLRYAGGYFHRVYDNHGYLPMTSRVSKPVVTAAGSPSTAGGSVSSGIGNIAGSIASAIGSVTAAANAFFMVNTIYFPKESDDSFFYLFARTNVQPYQYYYRTYNDNRKIWGNWQKIELGIEAREISSLVHLGRLYIFWTEAKSKENSKMEEGTSSSPGFIFTAYVKYSILDENGRWSAPQRLLVGQDFATRDTIYKRIRGGTFIEDSWEKGKDAIVEKFEELVFRKPYAFSNLNNKAAPVGLGFIWTPEMKNKVVTYETMPVNYNQDFGSFKIKFKIPSEEFNVTNNQFDGKVKKLTVSISLETKSPKMKFSVSASADLALVPGVCTFAANPLFNLKVGIVTIPILIPLLVPVPYKITDQPLSAKENTFNLSLSRSTITNPSPKRVFGLSTVNSYKKEYEEAYAENGDFVTHIEHGIKTLSDHKLIQDKTGLASILVSRSSGSDNIPVTTILTDEITDVLYSKGLEHFLSLPTQKMTDAYGQMFDFEGPYGEYYWEIFFHIPYLIGNHFNANQKFKEAKWWYERIFNPTTDEAPSETSPTDHNWQFREFRGLTPQKLRDILTDTKALEVYKKDPFDPHAIARLRISSYQKSIVMKYIDNLLDWGDYLFTIDTRESIGEAEMLYQMASDILGRRPVKMGKCETADESTLTWEQISGAVSDGSEFLITLENYFWTEKQVYEVGTGFIKGSKSLLAKAYPATTSLNFETLSTMASIDRASDMVPLFTSIAGANTNPLEHTLEKYDNLVNYRDVSAKRKVQKESRKKWEPPVREERDRRKNDETDMLKFRPHRRLPSFDLVRQSSLVFCVPENKDLEAYWDRVEDRRFKIWNCMNIMGIRRSLSLFQPPIDPMMLVRARASGLSLEDAIAMASPGTLPHYRFVYLIEKSRQFAQVAQNFGSALLSALEKKDGEELLRLRSVHEKNILRMTTQARKNQIKEAEALVKSAEEGLKNVENRVEYYDSLISGGLSGWETAQQITKHSAVALRTISSVFYATSGITSLLPQLGSPFSMKWGGAELGRSTDEWGKFMNTVASILDDISASAGLEAGHQRREQEWKQQLKLSSQELKQSTQQLVAAEIRHQISEHELAIHERNIEQTDELDEFYKNKFTNLGLYNYMASGLSRVYRSAYNLSLEMARLAERAYQFETFNTDFFIQNDNWQFDRAGLLAGEKLLQQLQQLERAYINSNVRVPEISQNFSLAMLDSSQLVQLRQTGSCNIEIPEVAFEVLYPGQYRRVIRSVSLSMPCIAGPFTNISGRLTLLEGKIEREDKSPLEEVAVAKNTSITTSSANNDPGIFELNFRDERYLPFEGAGAISKWRLELPSRIRSFDYDTISDVIIHMSYTALNGDHADAENKLGDMIEDHATTSGLYRLLSLRYDFPSSFNQLFGQAQQQTSFAVEKMHFPYLLSGMDLVIDQTKIWLKPVRGLPVTVPASLKVNGNNSVSFSASEDIALPGTTGNQDKLKGGTVSLSGSPLKTWTLDAGTSGLDKSNLDDILILIRYKI